MDVVAARPDPPALGAALALAERIAVNATLAVRAGKVVAYGVEGGVVDSESASWRRTAGAFDRLLISKDAKEGPLAFAEKRPAVWKARLKPVAHTGTEVR